MVGIVMVDEDDSASPDKIKEHATKQNCTHFVWGSGQNGQIGINENFIYEPRQIKLPNIQQIKLIACGDAHTIIVNEEGRLYAFGSNQHG